VTGGLDHCDRGTWVFLMRRLVILMNFIKSSKLIRNSVQDEHANKTHSAFEPAQIPLYHAITSPLVT